MKNRIEDLRNHLFAQLEKLSDEGCDLSIEIERGACMCQLAEVIIDSGRVEIEFLKATSEDANASTGFFPVAKEQRKYFIEKD